MAFHFCWSKTFRGEKTFILTNGGHVAGIVNPPANPRYSHYVSKLDYKLPMNGLRMRMIWGWFLVDYLGFLAIENMA